jgi:hypothetical protein
LVLAYNEDYSAVNLRIHQSAEVKQFRERRLGRLPGRLNVLVILSRGG